MKNFIKNNLKKLIVSSAIILCPIILGIALWDELPDIIATHWGISGEADGFSGRAMAVFGLPLFLLVFHWVCMIVTSFDKKNINQNAKAMGIVFWICPLISLYSSALIYTSIFRYGLNIISLSFLVFGIMFIVIGNYLPKVKQNNTLGIKISWTLKNEENWNATHRFSGKIWVIGGVIILFLSLLPIKISSIMFFCVLLAMIFIPIVYSYRYMKKQTKDATYIQKESATPTKKSSKIVLVINLVLITIVLAFCIFICFSGNIEYAFEESSFEINADYWEDISIKYEEIDSIEYRDEDNRGMRTFGFGTPRLLMGTFENDEFGTYTRYSYGGSNSCIVITLNKSILVISDKDDSKTLDIYNKLIEKCN